VKKDNGYSIMLLYTMYRNMLLQTIDRMLSEEGEVWRPRLGLRAKPEFGSLLRQVRECRSSEV